MSDLAGIVERDAEDALVMQRLSTVAPDGRGWHSDFGAAVADRRALLVLLRETSDALGSAHNPHDSSWRCEFPAGTPCECGVGDLMARLAALGETR